MVQIRLCEIPGKRRLLWKVRCSTIVFNLPFTATFHYLFPQLTMGLALLLVYFRTRALVTGD